MAVLPHPLKKDAWVIDYVTFENGQKVNHKVEFNGSLKEALEEEKKLRG